MAKTGTWERVGVRPKRKALAAVTSFALLTGMLVGAFASTSQAIAPVGGGFTVTPGDLAFILKQIRIAEEHSTTLTASNPCGTMLAQPGDGIPDNLQVPDVLTSYGLRTVDGSCNNLKAATGVPAPGQPSGPFAGNPDPAFFGAANQVFPRLTTPVFRDADPITPDFPVGPPGPTSYKSKFGSVVDAQPRIISNLIDDQTSTNPAAVAAAGHPVRSQNPNTPSAVPCTTDPDPTAVPPVDGVPLGCTPSHKTLFIPNITTDTGLSPPYNSLFTFFGQFFDHGVDQTVKSGGTVFIPLQADDPLRTLGPDGKPNTGDEVPANQAFMVLTRTQDQPGPDGVLHTADDIQDASNTDTPWVDQSQTYTSHASHQVFLREYDPATGAVDQNHPAAVATGNLLQGLVDDDPLPCTKPAPFECYNDGKAGAGSLSTWASVRKQAHDLFGMRLEDKDVLNIPMLATDPYGEYLPGPHGLPQYVTTTGLVEGQLDDPTTPGDETVPVPANVLYFDTPFVGDIAHNADPSPDPQTGVSPTPDPDSTIQTDFTKQAPGTYDDELLATHFTCGDGRCNENIALSTIHFVFHAEHDRLVNDIDNVLHTDTTPGAADRLADWTSTDDNIRGANGTGGWSYGQKLFQAARFVTEMEYQHLVFEEFARKVQPAVRPFHVYSPDINAAIDAEFAHAVYRFGHSMLDDTVARQDVNPDGSRIDNSLPLLNAFLNPPAFFDNSVDPNHPVYTAAEAAGAVVMGSSDQTGNEIDEFVTETLRNNLLGLPLDLPSINMARARDAGVPPLNQLRRQLFAQTNDGQLAPYTSWADFGQHMKHPESLINFVAAYGTHPSITSQTTLAGRRAAARAIVDPLPTDTQPLDASDFMFSTPGSAWASNPDGSTTTGLDNVDLWVGGLAELTNQNGGMLGSTFNYVFQTQLEKLQDGDRLYYLARTPGMNLRTQLEGNTFAEMIERNTDGTTTLKADAFGTADCKFELSNLNGTPAGFTQFGSAVADDPNSACDESKLLLRKPDGTIQYKQINTVDPSGINGQGVYHGTPGVDRVVGGVDNDTFWGDAGNDVIEGNNGDDQVYGGAGNDIETDLNGADVMRGGPGNDAIDAGPGDDIALGGDGGDFINGGANDNEEFAGPGNDYVIAGQGADAVFGDGGDDWIEGGTGQDLLQGDHGAPFFDDPAELQPGNDIFVGQPGENDYDAEGGDDIMTQNAAIDRNAGAGGFDWANHQFDTTPGNDDMMINNNLGGLPIQIVVNRDRWQETEADSGGAFNDVIKGTDGVLATPRLIGGGGFTGCDAIDQTGMNRIKGLSALLPPVADWIGTAAETASLSASGACPLTGPVWGEGDILLGGPGSDSITGRAGDEIIDGDKELRVAISVTDGNGNELGRTDLMENKATSGDFGPGTAGMTLQQAVFAGLVDPGNLVNVREIVDNVTAPADCGAASPVNCDTAVFAGPQSQYSITANANGSVTVTDNNSTPPTVTPGTPPVVAPATGDGTDTLFNVEQLQFSDGTVNLLTPSAVSAIAGNARATVLFTAPLGVSGITGFQIDVLTGTTLVNTVTAAANASSVIVTGLTNGTSYHFVVRALTAAGPGPDSASSNTVTPVAPPPAATVPAAPSIGTATAGDGQATVQWTPGSNGGSAITGYSVKVLDAANLQVGALLPATAGATSLVVTGLTNGSTYHFQVLALNSVGAGPFSASSNAVTPVGAPGAPTIGTATAGNASATVRWTAPVSNGGSAITGYSVQVLNVGNAQVGALRTAAAGATSLVVTGLTNGTTYHFVVSAVNANGTGAPSISSNPVTPATTPGAPTIRPATAGNASATVNWTAPANNGGSAITGYQVRVVNAATNVQVGALRNAGPGATSLVVTGLTNGTSYRFQVRTVNAVGSSAFSALSAAVTPATTPGAPVIGTAVAGTPGGAVTATANWTPPAATGGSAITGYRVTALRINAAGTVVATTVSAVQPAARRTLAMTLTAGNYRFTVQAINAVGNGPQSARSNLVAAR
jgi:Ca2+-binding RTX toxin-like protein